MDVVQQYSIIYYQAWILVLLVAFIFTIIGKKASANTGRPTDGCEKDNAIVLSASIASYTRKIFDM